MLRALPNHGRPTSKAVPTLARSTSTFTLALSGCVLGAALSFAPNAAHAQRVQLPPPPPPPLATDKPPSSPPPSSERPPPPSSGSSGTRAAPDSGRRPPSTRHRAPSTEPTSRASYATESSYYGPRRTTLRLNPIPIFAGRLSADIELQLAPHHAIVISPNATWKAWRPTLAQYGFGFANRVSWGLGGEFGYHYWIGRRMEGLYLGPSGVFGLTFPTAPADGFAYYGVAFDVGWQLVLGNGFTANFGGGLLVIGARDAQTRVLPRALVGIGWSF